MNKETDSDILQVQGVNSKGYGIVPKMVMQDQRLSIQAKAIYSYFCSYAGASKTAFPRTTKIMKDLDVSKNSYYKYFNELKQYGYVKVEQDKDKSGKFARNIFTLVQVVPCTKNNDTDSSVSPCPNLRDTVKRDTKICDTNNNNNNNIKNNIFKNISQSSQLDQQTGQDKTNVKTGNYLEKNQKTHFEISNPIESSVSELEQYSNLIKTNIRYSDFASTRANDLPLVDAFVSIILDVIFTKGGDVRIKQEIKDREIVKSQLLKLTQEHICLAIERFRSVTKPVTHKKQYLLTTLYIVTDELEAHQANVASQKKALENPEVVAEKKDAKPEPPKSKNKFNHFPQRERTEEYYAALERHLLNKK